MLDELKKIDEKLEKVNEKLASIDVTLVKQHASLDQHIYRTSLSEARLEHIEETLIPLQKHVSQVDGALKLIGVLATIGGTILTVIKLFL